MPTVNAKVQSPAKCWYLKSIGVQLFLYKDKKFIAYSVASITMPG